MKKLINKNSWLIVYYYGSYWLYNRKDKKDMGRLIDEDMVRGKYQNGNKRS